MKEKLSKLIQSTILKLKQMDQLPVDLTIQIQLDRTKDANHGDYTSNVALVFGKAAGKSPREFAQLLIDHFELPQEIEKVEIAGPGFINFFVHHEVNKNIVVEILEKKDSFGWCDFGKNEKVLIEFVSANPTGPLHVGHGRGAAYGSVVADLLKTVGYQVHREYYVNDAGRQMDILAVSIWLRYLELLGEIITVPANAYLGAYIVDIARELKEKHDELFYSDFKTIISGLPKDEIDGGNKEIYIDALIARAKNILSDRYEIIYAYGIENILNDIKEDLTEFRVQFDEWFSEKKLVQSGAIQKGIDALKDRKMVYEKERALWFRSTKFGDEKDRVLLRSNEQPTYFASDVAYHWNKLNRGFHQLINVFGADHHGYVTRVKAAVEALGLDHHAIRIPLVQFAALYRHGKKVQMSTRSGSFVTLRELREEAGNDATRFFYVMRRCDQHLDFDLDLAKSKSNENPVYYVQYAHARICSVFRQLEEKHLTFDVTKGLSALNNLTKKSEKTLLKTLSLYPEVVLTSAKYLEPHRIVNFLRDLASHFHVYYNSEQFLVKNKELRQARLCLILAVKQVIQNGLKLLSVSAPEKM